MNSSRSKDYDGNGTETSLLVRNGDGSETIVGQWDVFAAGALIMFSTMNFLDDMSEEPPFEGGDFELCDTDVERILGSIEETGSDERARAEMFLDSTDDEAKAVVAEVFDALTKARPAATGKGPRLVVRIPKRVWQTEMPRIFAD